MAASLYDLADRVPSQAHSPTSVFAANEQRSSGKARTDSAIVEAYLLGCGPAGSTDEEGQLATGLGVNTYRPRRIGLSQRKPPVALDSGRTRLTRSKHPAVVWVHAKHAPEAKG